MEKLGVIPNFSILLYMVFRSIPSSRAAFALLPLVCCRAATMRERSESSSYRAVTGAGCVGPIASVSFVGVMRLPRVRSTARFTTLLSSRRLPGHEWEASSSAAAESKPSTERFSSSLAWRMKRSAKRKRSVPRSESLGM